METEVPGSLYNVHSLRRTLVVVGFEPIIVGLDVGVHEHRTIILNHIAVVHSRDTGFLLDILEELTRCCIQI